jgi:hypothetical protein
VGCLDGCLLGSCVEIVGDRVAESSFSTKFTDSLGVGADDPTSNNSWISLSPSTIEAVPMIGEKVGALGDGS